MTMDKNDYFKYSILLVDDHPPVRRAVKKIIEASPEFQVIGEFNDGRALLKFLEKSPAHLVVLDISMPHVNGFEATRRIKQDYPDIKVLIMSIHNYREYVERVMSFGAEGYLLKEEIGDELLPAITSLRQGGTYFSSRLPI
jgi:DNA-binding NarL/FixJ family response regulator